MFEAYITNTALYPMMGIEVGTTVHFPTTTQEVQAALAKIGIDGKRYSEVFITSFDSDVLGLYDYLDEYENIDELNELGHALLEVRDKDGLETFEAALVLGKHTGSVKDLINLTQNLDLYRFYPDISDDEGLGHLYADELGTIDIPEHIQGYFDYEAYGRDMRINEGGVFAPGGYVAADPVGFKEHYHGTQDISPEHRVFAYLYQGRDVKEAKDRCLKDQILVIAPHEALIPSDTWLKCRKKLMANTTFQQGRKPKNTWLAGKIKCGHCGYALKATHVPNSTGYFRCTKRTENKGCPGCGKIRKEEFEQFIFSAMQERFKDFQILHGQEEKVNPKLTAYQVELAQVEAEIEKLLDTLTGANATLLAYANKKIEELDTRRQTISKAIANLSVETISPQQIKKLSYYLDNWESIDFDDKRKAADGLISTIKATSDRVQIEWKI